MFSTGYYPVMDDIEEMYHQILVENKHCDVLHFLLGDNYVDSIEGYYMNVHLFGNVDSPCIANWTIKKNAADQSDSFDQISIKTIENDFYMDHFLSSFHEVSVAVCLDIINVLQKGGSRLTKFISNNCSIHQALPMNNVSPKLTEINLSVNDISIKRALRILWNPETDTSHIKRTLKSVLATKRGISSLISSTFIPSGLIAPGLIEAKWIIQQHCKTKMDWYELLLSDLTKCRQKWLDNLPDIQNITLDIWYGLTDTDTELDIFADASKIAYGAHVISDLTLTINQNAVLVMSNPNLCLSIRNQNRLHYLNYQLP